MNVSAKKKSFLFKKIIGQIVFLALFLLFLNIFQSEIKNSFYIISSPLRKTIEQTGRGVSLVFESFTSFQKITEENKYLRIDNQKLLSQNIFLQELLKENQMMKELLENSVSYQGEVVSGNIIGLDTNNDFFIFDKGLVDGIKEDIPLIVKMMLKYKKPYYINLRR